MIGFRIAGTVIMGLSWLIAIFKNRYLFDEEFRFLYLGSVGWGAIWRGLIIAFLWLI